MDLGEAPSRHRNHDVRRGFHRRLLFSLSRFVSGAVRRAASGVNVRPSSECFLRGVASARLPGSMRFLASQFGIAMPWAHSRSSVGMDLAALPLLLGVYGRVRICRGPRLPQVVANALMTFAALLPVITLRHSTPWLLNQVTRRERKPISVGFCSSASISPDQSGGSPRSTASPVESSPTIWTMSQPIS